MGSKIIRKRSFTSARPHDSKETDNLLSGDEKAVFGDSAYGIKLINKRLVNKVSIMVCWIKPLEAKNYQPHRKSVIQKNKKYAIKLNILLDFK